MRKPALTTEEKGKLIGQIMQSLKNEAFLIGKHFDESIFFSLAFKTDKELINIKNLTV